MIYYNVNDYLMSNEISSRILCDIKTIIKLKFVMIYSVDYVHIEFLFTKKMFFSLFVIVIIYKEVKSD